MRALIAIVACLFLASCETSKPVVLDVNYIGNVQSDLKHQLGVYYRFIDEIRKKQIIDPAADPNAIYYCGKGKIDFDIASVKMDLLTTSDITNAATASATIPVTTVVKVGPSGSVSKEVTNTQELVFNQWLAPDAAQPIPLKNEKIELADLEKTPIAKFLVTLRTALIASARGKAAASTSKSTLAEAKEVAQACLTDFDPNTPSADPQNSYKTGLTFVTDDKLGLTLGIGIISLGGSNEQKDTNTNTLTVSFRQTDIPYGIKRCTKDPTKYCQADGTTQSDWSVYDSGVGLQLN